MPDLFDTVNRDLEPRLRPIKGNPKAKALFHPCSVCGSPGCFGREVQLRKEKFGEWFCAKCLPGDFYTRHERSFKL